MRKPASRAWVAVFVGLVTTGASGASDTAPVPRAVDDTWLPRAKARDPRDDGNPVAESPPSVFPELVFRFPVWNGSDGPAEHQQKVDAVAAKTWPRLAGNAGLKIEQADDPRNKALKAQLRQGVLEYQDQFLKGINIVGADMPYAPRVDCLTGLQNTATELYAGQPMQLAAWLGELLIAAKNEERYTRLRVGVGALHPARLDCATRHRLKLELDLWKVQNPAAQCVEAPVRKDNKNEKPVEGDWLAEKKLPPTLFPDLALPAPEKFDPKHGWQFLIDLRRAIQYARLCPRLSGNTGLKIEPSDDTPRRLLKARLYQGAMEVRSYRAEEYSRGVGPDPSLLSLRCDCLYDVVNAAVELWENQPKELVSWLEELLIETKDFERFTFIRFEAGVVRASWLHQTTRVRLKVESELWKAKNAK